MRMAINCLATAASMLALAGSGYTQQGNGAEPSARALAASKHYFLPATPENVQWGWYDLKEKPKLIIHSGDTVSIETLSHSLGQIKPGVDMDEIVKLRKENDGGGPHSITGPIYVYGAEPGDTLEIRILKIVPKADAFNFNLPGKEFPTVGLLASEFPGGFRALLQAGSWQDADAIQAGHRHRPEALPGNLRGRSRSRRAGRQGRPTNPRCPRAAPARCGPGRTARTWI